MNSNEPLGLEELNSLPEVLPDAIPETTPILAPVLPEENPDLGAVLSSPPIPEEEESTALENGGNDRLIEEDAPEIVTPSVDLTEQPIESVGDPPPLPEAIADSETEVNTPSQEDPQIEISDPPTLQEDPETVLIDPPLVPEGTIDVDETSNPPSLDEDPPVPIDPPISEAIPNEFIVKLNPALRSTDLADLKTSMGAEVLGTTNMGIQLWQIPDMDLAAAKATVSNDPRIEYIEPNYRGQVINTPNDPEFTQLWGLDNTGQTGGTADADIDAPEAWDISTNSNILVGVIDTGVDYTHPDLDDNIWTNPGEIAGNNIDDDGNGFVDDIHGYDFVNDDGDPMDDNYHGTHVAGTIAAEGNNDVGVVGVNWNAQIMGIKWIDGDGFGNTFDAIQAVEYSTLMGVKITNNSWRLFEYSQGLYDAIAAAGEAGNLFVAAAGNDARDTDLDPNYPSAYDLDNIISVAATDHNDQLADFSNYGTTTVDLGAPGVDVYSTFPNNSYDTLSGTSMASPHVAGVASLLWSQNPDLTAAEVKNILLTSVDPIPALDGITVSGGRLNAYQALVAPVGAKIQGSKWNDADGDGNWDSSESALPGWTIYLDANNNSELDEGETSTLTNAQGQYVFPFLTPGTYTVAEVLKPGWTQTTPSSPGTYTVELEEEEVVSDLNFGNQLTNPASISGSKWNDEDEDGVWDATENSLPGWTIYLDTNQNGELDPGELSTVTDENGEYSFTDLEVGTYTVAEVLEPGWGQSYPQSNPPRLGNGTHTLELEADENATDINFGNYELPPGNISGSKWHDLDGDSIRDEGEPGLEGWTIYLDANQNGQLDDGELSTVTDEDGNYSFTDLPYGTYTVAEELQPTWVQSYPGVSNLLNEPNDTIPDAVASGITHSGIFNAAGVIGDNTNISPEFDVDFIKVDLEAGDRITINIDADNFGSPLDSILRVFDSTGTQVAVNDDFDGLDSYIDFTASYADTYYVGVSGYDNFFYDPFVEGSGYGYNTGDYNLTINVGDGTTIPLLGSHTINLEPGETLTNIDFGNWQPITLSGTKWHDLDGDGTQDADETSLEGWTIYLDTNNNGQLDDGETSTVTDAEGNYSFTLPEGTYTVAEVQQTGWVQTAPTDGSYTVSLDAGEVADDLDFGNQALPVTISGAKWNDLNGNGSKDAEDPGIEGWTIYLDLNNSGILDEGDLSTLTDADGNYSFTNLPFGSYTVSEEVPATWEQTSPGYFYNASHYVYLGPGETFGSLDFGNWQPSFISGTKWHDIDADGTQDADEPGLKGWTIYLDANNNGQLDTGETSTVTDAQGNYSFKLGTGTYTVAEVQKTGWIQTAPADGSQTVFIAPGEVKDVDFGNQAQPGEIHGSKWNDVDADGEWDGTEPGLEGWTIYLDTNKNGQLDDAEQSTVTDADGNYSFTDLTYGSYTVVEEQQPGWEQTSPNGFANEVTPLTNNEVGDYNPDVSGNQVVWSGYDGVDDEIYLYDDNQVVQLTDNQTYEYNVQISDGNVVWQGYDGVDDDEIYLYQGGEVVQLTNNQTYEYNVQISGNNVVWTQEYYDDNYNYYSDIYLYDGSQVVQLTNNDYYEYDVKISGNKVVWSAYDGNDNEIYLYDGSQVVQLTNNDVDEYSPDIDGNNVVWQGYGVNYSEIYFYDGSQVVRLTDNYNYEYSPQISDGNVIWQSSDGVDDDEIYLYDGSQVIQLTDNQSYEYGVQISGNTVAWYAYGNDYDYDYDSEIYVYDGSQVIQLTNNDYYENSPQVSNGNVVWSSFDGTDDEIYTYGQGNTYPVAVQPGEIVTNINFGNHSQSNQGTPGDDVLVGTPQPDEIEGFGGNDRLSGLADKDTLKGGSGNDTVFGGDGDDVIVGQNDNDRLYGEKGDDGVRGNKGDDLVVGGEGNDRVYGGDGMDTLIGVDPNNSQPGLGEIDELYGVQGGDRFVLGDASKVYYNDGDDTTSGLNDYASIEDFVLGQNVIQLSGNASNYFLAASPTGLSSGTAIFLETGNTDELIGVVRNVPLAQLELTSSSFSYV
jgi:subtilisin family serine protease